MLKETRGIVPKLLVCMFFMVLSFIALTEPVSAGHTCPVCEEWIDGDPYCVICYTCEDCTSNLCDQCGMCTECAVLEGAHCSECGETCLINDDEADTCKGCNAAKCCVDLCSTCGFCEDCAKEYERHCVECGSTCFEEAGDSEYCEICHKCGDCVELMSGGGVCKECYEENGDLDSLCPKCLSAVVKGADGEELDAMGPCGVHCQDCFDSYECPECYECSLCNDVEICKYCGTCENDWAADDLHCEECGNCYDDVSRCYEGGSHCRDCCENNGWLCTACGDCFEGASKDYCTGCGACEDCTATDEIHCGFCGSCYETTDRCYEGSTHCEDCCMICEACGRCVLPYSLAICEYCGYCEEDCAQNSIDAGFGGVCVEDPDLISKVGSTEHTTHILKFDYDEDTHWSYCVIDGCDYMGEPKDHDAIEEIILKAPTGYQEGLKAYVCHVCGKQYSTEILPKEVWHFEVSPTDLETKNGCDLPLTYTLMSQYGDKINFSYIAVIVSEDGTWPDYAHALDHALQTFASTSIKYQPEYENQTYQVRLYAYGFGTQCYSDVFTISWNKNHTHTYQLVYGTKHQPLAGIIYGHGWHWYECICGEYYGVHNHSSVQIYDTTTCQKRGGTGWVCTVCGISWEVEYEGKLYDHLPGSKWYSAGDVHYQRCQYCGTKINEEDHKWVTDSSKTVCAVTTTVKHCSVCGEKKTEKTPATTPNHTYNNNWIWGYNETEHWYFCKDCGYKKVSKHSFTTSPEDPDYEYCDACFYHKPDYYVSLTNVHICPHVSTQALFTGLTAAQQQRIQDWNNVSFKWTAGGEIVMGTGGVYMPTLADCQKWNWNQTVTFTVSFEVTDIAEFSVNAQINPLTKIAEVPATCGDSGVKEHYLCICGKIVDKNGNAVSESSLVIPATGKHTYDDDCDETCNVCTAAREAPHSFDGSWSWDDTYHFHACGLCGLQREKAEHNHVVTLVKAGSCYGEAVYRMECDTCGMSLDYTVPATAHQIEKAEECPSTCVTNGYREHYECIFCGTTYEDQAGTVKVPLNDLRLPLDPENHEGGKYSHNDDQHWMTCACGEIICKEDHTLDDEKYCAVCGYKYYNNPNRHNVRDKKDAERDAEDNGDDDNTAQPDRDEETENRKGGAWLWAAIAAAVLLLAAVVVIVIILLCRRKEAPEDAEAEEAGEEEPEA